VSVADVWLVHGISGIMTEKKQSIGRKTCFSSTL